MIALGSINTEPKASARTSRLREVAQILRNWRPLREESGTARQIVFTVCIYLLVAGVGVLDFVAGPRLSLTVVYLVPVLVGTWLRGWTYGLGVVTGATLISFAADFLRAGGFDEPVAPWMYWNTVVRLIGLAIVVYLLGMARRVTQELEGSVATVTDQLYSESDERRRIESELLRVADEERRRLSQDLHDDLASYLTGVAFRAKALEGECAQGSEALRQRAKELVGLVNAGVARVRAIAGTLDPVYASSNGLPSALERLAAQTEDLFGIGCFFEDDAPGFEIDVQRGVHLYRIAQEAVQNAVKHGKAKEIRLGLRTHGEHITLTIRDDGIGFHPAPNASAGLGLRTMRYRTDLMHGTIRITALADHGCEVVCAIPTESRENQ